MNLNPLISIIIPVYNAEQYLERCIDSIIKQSYINIEIILVNDGSNDKSPEICDKYVFIDSRVRVIHKSNGGQASARNAGLNLISGQFFSFLDSDDYFHEDFVKILFNLIFNHNADIAQCNYITGNDQQFPLIIKKEKVEIFDNRSVFLENVSKIVFWAKLYRTTLWNDIRIPIDKSYEDDFTTWKVYHKAKKIVIINLPLYYYFKHPGGITVTWKNNFDMDFIEAYKQRLEYFYLLGDKELYIHSKSIFCITLMLNYLTKKRNENNIPKLQSVLKMYKENSSEVITDTIIPLNRRILFSFFYYFPNTFRWLVQRFKLK